MANTLESILSLRASDPQAFDSAIAVKVMEWREGAPGKNAGLWVSSAGKEMAWNFTAERWSPSSNPTADYAVLVHVREQWTVEQQIRFANWVVKIYWDRAAATKWLSWELLLRYIPGDYAAAALAVIEESAKPLGRPETWSHEP